MNLLSILWMVVCACLVVVALSMEAPLLPKTHLLDAKTLVQTKQQLAEGDNELAKAYKALLTGADWSITQGTFSVMTKKGIAPSNNKHDYYSISTYYWPCNWDPLNIPPGCNTTTGYPWVRRDGEENPDRSSGDNYPLGYMATNVTQLALAYFFSGEEKYAKAATALLQTWFLNGTTKMNPNMDYAQWIPGGTGTTLTDGIIDARYFIDSGGTVDPYSNYKTIGGVIEAAPLLEGSLSWTSSNNAQLQLWFREYLDWLLTTPQGIHSSKEPNNHGTWYDVQCMSYALYVEDSVTLYDIAVNISSRRIVPQIQPNGSLPLELARTKAFWYSFFALAAFWDVADMALYSGVDDWHFNSTDGRSLQNALDFLVPYVIGEKAWPYQQIIFFDRGVFFQMFRRASYVYGAKYESYIDKLPSGRQFYSADVVNLIYPRKFY